jgi:hypothetical protein
MKKEFDAIVIGFSGMKRSTAAADCSSLFETQTLWDDDAVQTVKNKLHQ